MHERSDDGPAPPPSAMHDDVLTADEVASMLRMTPAWVYSETRRNRIPHVRLGRRFRYRRAAIEAWLGTLEVDCMPNLPTSVEPSALRDPELG
jgi:excisionase family DNA binding protein